MAMRMDARTLAPAAEAVNRRDGSRRRDPTVPRATGRRSRLDGHPRLHDYTVTHIEQERRMPLYEYRCPDCGVRTERMRKVSERAKGPGCPECGSATILALSAPGRVGATGSGDAGIGAGSGPVSPCGPGGCGVSFN